MIECERVSEHSTRSDRVTDIGSLFSSEASVSPPNELNQKFFRFEVVFLFDEDIVCIVGRDCEDSYFIFCEKC